MPLQRTERFIAYLDRMSQSTPAFVDFAWFFVLGTFSWFVVTSERANDTDNVVKIQPKRFAFIRLVCRPNPDRWEL